MESLKPGYHRIPNRCIDRLQCQLHHVCPKERYYRQYNTCYQSNEYRMKFREERCPKLQMTLYVCNGCREENRCTLRKQFYVHDTAEKSYRKMLVCSRTGASITEAERLFLSERIDQKIQKRTILPSYSCIRRRSDHGREKRPCIATSMPVYFEPNAAICLVPVETCKTKRTKMMSPRPPRKRF